MHNFCSQTSNFYVIYCLLTLSIAFKFDDLNHEDISLIPSLFIFLHHNHATSLAHNNITSLHAVFVRMNDAYYKAFHHLNCLSQCQSYNFCSRLLFYLLLGQFSLENSLSLSQQRETHLHHSKTHIHTQITHLSN